MGRIFPIRLYSITNWTFVPDMFLTNHGAWKRDHPCNCSADFNESFFSGTNRCKTEREDCRKFQQWKAEEPKWWFSRKRSK